MIYARIDSHRCQVTTLRRKRIVGKNRIVIMHAHVVVVVAAAVTIVGTMVDVDVLMAIIVKAIAIAFAITIALLGGIRHVVTVASTTQVHHNRRDAGCHQARCKTAFRTLGLQEKWSWVGRQRSFL